MNDVEPISVTVVGEDSQETFVCSFKVKTLISRQDKFISDQRRRELLGPNPNDALAQNQFEAFMLGELFVRIVEPPDWWRACNFGANIRDANVIATIYNAAFDKEKERKAALKKKADEALSKLAAAPQPAPQKKAAEPKQES
jgi:hypothetical protein